MAMINSIRDRESPCRMPLRCLIGGPWCPFKTILEVAVESRVAIQLHHLSPNPLALNNSSRKGHDRVSKALDMSNLRSSMGHLFLSY